MSTTTASAAPTTTRPRSARWALGVLAGPAWPPCTCSRRSGRSRLDPMVVEGFAMMGIGPGLTVTIGVIELLAAIGLLIPRLSGLAATGCVVLMTGAVISTLATLGVAMALVPAVVLVCVAVVGVGAASRDRRAGPRPRGRP